MWLTEISRLQRYLSVTIYAKSRVQNIYYKLLAKCFMTCTSLSLQSSNQLTPLVKVSDYRHLRGLIHKNNLGDYLPYLLHTCQQFICDG